MNTKWTLIAGLVLVAGCKKEEAAVAPPTNPTPKPVPAAAAPAAELKGTVQEKLDAANYTYLRLKTATGEVWAAVPATALAVGTEVVVSNPMPMEGFESKTLQRKFDVVMFGAGAVPVGGAAAAPAANPHAPGAANPHGDAPAAAPAPAADEKVAKAEGADGRTVSEVFAQKAALANKTVAVRGKVTKLTSGVLGRTWLHLRDGSGSDATTDNDITVTTQDTAAVGDVVTVKGVVHLDKDLGSGYAYPVIIEDAAVTK